MGSEIYKKAGYVISSTYRSRVMTVLLNIEHSTPTNIARFCGIRTAHISKVLKELKDEGLVVCINEEVRKGRLYRLTDEGKQVINVVINMKRK